MFQMDDTFQLGRDLALVMVYSGVILFLLVLIGSSVRPYLRSSSERPFDFGFQPPQV